MAAPSEHAPGIAVVFRALICLTGLVAFVAGGALTVTTGGAWPVLALAGFATVAFTGPSRLFEGGGVEGGSDGGTSGC